jgi:thiamine biosynthesis lipoprotein
VLSGLLAAVITTQATEPALSRFEFAETHMGSRVQITLYANDEASAKRAATAAFARIAELDGIMSDYRPTSELMQLCQKAGGGPVRVGDDLFSVLSHAQEVSRRSGGAFDVTVGPVVRLWRRARKSFLLPDPDDLARARALVGYQMVTLDPKARTVQLQKKGMQLDLGGIAKGYAADAALKLLKEHGVSRALVALSGDIAASGPPPGEDGWKIGVAPLEGTRSPPSRFVLLKNAAVSTSGDAEQYVEIDGKRYSHIVDPKTGIGLVGRIGVTVIAPNGTTADPLATAACVLGPERGLKLIEETPGAAALFVWKTEKGEETITSKRFPSEPRP